VRMDLVREVFDELRRDGVLTEESSVQLSDFFAVCGVGDSAEFVAVGLARGGEQDQRCCVGSLSRERSSGG
jgi:hypothetical protein